MTLTKDIYGRLQSINDNIDGLEPPVNDVDERHHQAE